MIVIAFIILVFLENNTAHDTPWSAAASEKLELSETLLWENIKTVEGYPAAMREASGLFHERGVEGFVCQLETLVRDQDRRIAGVTMSTYIDHHAARRALQPLRGHVEVGGWLTADAVSWNTRGNNGRLFEVCRPGV
jgi:hypothetical protein